ncbi:hypothetical protein [Streptomyces scabiei]|uniref:hypothetical protein n=1 Tax=Streptomyces scabiei TaxID=1930 RepID=UPI001B33FC8C|nr:MULTISPECIES: hypothetical protein [Streptomyces]MBP5889060.1 hypothetical protein [Streptomyces sp. LBUM 1481]MBP5919079.1 hypothetical protein [Streptomyces sp. LBUM 1483]MDX2688529.1 hypothetical protein [Streptomyces scabiei]MDX2753699.1 hypothetical protein [Streptomyces scabiei]MDX2806132.1 hypothetical protein [Streptomyces scabiei]
MASPPRDDQDAPVAPRGRRRRSWPLDLAVALLFLIMDTVIVMTAGYLLMVLGHGITASATHSGDVPVLTWLIVWGVPAVGAASAVTHGLLRMPISCVVQGLFTLACTILAVNGTRMILL